MILFIQDMNDFNTKKMSLYHEDQIIYQVYLIYNLNE